MRMSESIDKLAPALLKAQVVMGKALKDAKNPFFKSSFADLNSVREAVLPPLHANNMFVLQPTVHIDGKSFVETIIMHESGQFAASLTEIVVAKQNDPQASGSAISYARRYGLQSFPCLAAVDDDGETAMARNKPTPAPTPKVETVPEKEPLALVPQASKAPQSTPAVVPATTTPARRTPFKRSVPTLVPAQSNPTTKPSNPSAGDGW